MQCRDKLRIQFRLQCTCCGISTVQQHRSNRAAVRVQVLLQLRQITGFNNFTTVTPTTVTAASVTTAVVAVVDCGAGAIQLHSLDTLLHRSHLRSPVQ
jgi:hypothetical protein